MPKNKPASQKASAGQKKRATKGAKTAPRKTGAGRKATKKKAAAKQTQVRKPKRPQVVPAVPQALQAPPEAKADALQSEGASMQERLQSMIKEHEAHAEKLRARITKDISSNKELQSINEELEATAEELQASNEELILLNEELRSSNAELNNRNVELEQLASDLSHLIAGVQIPIVVVGNDMRVRRFTPAAQKLLNLIPTDVGRPIGHIKPNIAIQDFESLISDVVDNWQTVEREIRDDAGHWHLLRIRPYRTAKNKVEGALIALMDIDTAKRAAEAIVETIRESLVVLDSQCRVTTANPAFYQTFGVSPREVENRSFFELQDGLWNVPELRLALEEMLPQNRQLENFELHLHEAQDTTRIMLLNARQLYKEGVGTGTILVAIQDITERKRAEEKLRQSEERYRALVNETPVAILVRTRKKIVFANPACAELFGVKSPDELIGRNPIDFVHPDHRSLARERMQRMDDKAAPAQAIERQAVRVDGRIVDVEVLATPILYNGRSSSHVLMLDTTAKKEAERKLRQLSQVFMDAADPIVIRDLEAKVARRGDFAMTEKREKGCVKWFKPRKRYGLIRNSNGLDVIVQQSSCRLTTGY